MHYREQDKLNQLKDILPQVMEGNRFIYRVIAFGSVARGEAHDDSDIDLLWTTPKPLGSWFTMRTVESMLKSDLSDQGLTTGDRPGQIHLQYAFDDALEHPDQYTDQVQVIENIRRDGVLLYDRNAL